MATTRELLLMASRNLVDAELALQEARTARMLAKAQYDAVNYTLHNSTHVLTDLEQSDLYRRLARVDDALSELRDFTDNV